MEENNSLNFTAILDAMEDGIYIINRGYIIEFMNKAMVRRFGHGVGRKCFEVVGGQKEICEWCSAGPVFNKGETIHREYYHPATGKNFNVTDLPIQNLDGTLSKLSLFRDITTSKFQETKLRETEGHYKRLFEHVGSGVYISSKEGKFIDVNQALMDMLGYEDKQELLNIDLSKDLYVKPEHRKKFQEMIEKEGRVIDYEVDFKRKDGCFIPVLLTSHVRYDQEGNIIGYEGINVDLSQRKKMERELREAHDFLNNIVQNSPNAVMSADLKGTMILWNKGAERMLGYGAEDVIGKMNITEIYPLGMARQVMKMMRGGEYGEPGLLRYYPVVFKQKEGGEVDGHLSASIIFDENGKEIATVGIFVDLRDSLAMEKKLHRTQEQLLQSEKLAAMGRLTSQIAHELNNPLYGIMNTLELMKTEIGPENRRRKLLEMSLSETMRLADMLKKMLSFSKPDQEERNPVDMNVLLDEILLLYEKQLFENSIKLSKQFGDDQGLVNASKNQLRQVFLNMISNAKDAMPEGGTLTIQTATDADHVKIIFSDTGIGIQKENINRIFDAFYTTKDSVKGVGLGLSVCYGFIKDHGGEIEVESIPESGTTFSITLPLFKKE
jgi:PAS domain S-box-containing protein